MKMTPRKLVIAVAAVIASIMVTFPPAYYRFDDQTRLSHCYWFRFSPIPHDMSELIIDAKVLNSELIVLGILTAAAFYIAGQEKSSK